MHVNSAFFQESKELREGLVVERVFTAIIEKEECYYIGYIKEVPRVNTQGKTLAEVRANLREALELVLEAKRELNDNIRY